MRELVIGEDHGFGRGRVGDVEMLRVLGTCRRVRGGRRAAGAGSGVRTGVEHRASARRSPAGTSRWRPDCSGGRIRLSGRGGAGGAAGPDHRGPDDQPAACRPRKLLPPDGVYAVRVEWAGGRHGGHAQPGAAADVRRSGPGASRPTSSTSTGTCTARGSGWNGWPGSATCGGSRRSRRSGGSWRRIAARGAGGVGQYQDT